MIEYIHAVPLVFVVSGSLLLFMAFLSFYTAQKMVQKIEQKSIPSAQELFDQDTYIPLLFGIIILFAIFSSVLALVNQPEYFFLALWQVALILVIFILYAYLQRLFSYTRPQFLFAQINKQCLRAAQNGSNNLVFQKTDILIEVIAKAAATTHISLASLALQQLMFIIENFVKIGNHSISPDLLQSFIAYVSRRLEWLFELSLQNKMMPIAEEIIATFGNMSLFFAKYHPPLTQLPLVFIEHCSDLAFQYNRDDVNIRTAATLSELIKKFILLSLEQRQSMKETMLLTLSHLEANIQKSFKKNKEINPALLMQPFAEIGELLGQAHCDVLIDREEILTALKRILTAFNALDLIMQKKKQSV